MYLLDRNRHQVLPRLARTLGPVALYVWCIRAAYSTAKEISLKCVECCLESTFQF